MGRSRLIIRSSELQSVVTQLESTTTFSSISELCEAIAATPWAKDMRNEKHAIRGLSPQVAGRELKTMNISYVTKAGRRGRAVGGSVVKTSRSDKAKKLKLDKFAAALRKEVTSTSVNPVPERYQRYAELALQGNVMAACKLKCGECMGYTGAEKACDGGLGGTPCPLYVINRLCYNKRRGFKPDETGFYQLLKDETQGE